MLRGNSWGTAPFLPRPMSLMTGGLHPSFLVKTVGEATRLLANSQPEDTFSLLGPLGNPWSDLPAHHDPILVAGGVGVAPLLFLATALSGLGRRPTLLYGVRTAHEIVLLDQLHQVADVLVTTDDASMGTPGRVSGLLETKLAAADSQTMVYACGPHPMMAAVSKLCSQHQVPCEVSLESVMGCGYGVCLGCAIPRIGGGYLYACRDGACVCSNDVAWEDPA